MRRDARSAEQMPECYHHQAREGLLPLENLSGAQQSMANCSDSFSQGQARKPVLNADGDPGLKKVMECAEKLRLADVFVEATLTLIDYHNQEVTAVLNNDLLIGIDKALRQASEKRDTAKRAYIEHLQDHGCGC